MLFVSEIGAKVRAAVSERKISTSHQTKEEKIIMKKRFAALLLVAVLLISLAPAAFAAKPQTGLNVVLNSATMDGVSFEVSWNKIPVYSYIALACLYNDQACSILAYSSNELKESIDFGRRINKYSLPDRFIGFSGTIGYPDIFYGKWVRIEVTLKDKDGIPITVSNDKSSAIQLPGAPPAGPEINIVSITQTPYPLPAGTTLILTAKTWLDGTTTVNVNYGLWYPTFWFTNGGNVRTSEVAKEAEGFYEVTYTLADTPDVPGTYTFSYDIYTSMGEDTFYDIDTIDVIIE